jgi:hypothetical protein
LPKTNYTEAYRFTGYGISTIPIAFQKQQKTTAAQTKHNYNALPQNFQTALNNSLNYRKYSVLCN